MQVLEADLQRTGSISSIVHSEMSSMYVALLALMILVVLVNSGICVLALCSVSYSSRRMMALAILLLPLGGMLLWATDTLAYAAWISAKDICNASSAFVAASSQQQLASQVTVDFVPCVHYLAMDDLANSGRDTFVKLMQRSNTLIQGMIMARHRPLSCRLKCD